ncbi:MAG: molybdopterin-guanine dinucleotide biosynthesis protein B [Eggerthellaceae bacterium]|nr:molybdopterin-guanine dinucleotide biosynthesis protein B [Eggerthellaceae bacterium]
MGSLLPSPAVAIVGRHNSGKTTLIVSLIGELCARGLDVGSIKHHSHAGFDIDVPGKDSFRHREAGASETIIAAPDQMAQISTLAHELECADLVARMPGHDIVLVEGYRKSGIPTIEVMRSGNAADVQVAQAFLDCAKAGEPLSSDFVQRARWEASYNPSVDVVAKMPHSSTVAVVSDIPAAREAAKLYEVPVFTLGDVSGICDFLDQHFVRSRVTVAIQAGGESKRMGRSKATVPFAGRPLIARMVERVAPAADEILITTNEPENLQFLFDDFPGLPIRLVRDALDERGALPGLLTAFQAATTPFVAIVACDMVFASPNLIAAECAELALSQADCVVPVNKHGFEPFHSVYVRETCLPAVRAHVDAGEKRAQSMLPDLKVRHFSRSEVLAAEPMGGCFINVNTPEELEAIERQFLEL